MSLTEYRKLAIINGIYKAQKKLMGFILLEGIDEQVKDGQYRFVKDHQDFKAFCIIEDCVKKLQIEFNLDDPSPKPSKKI